MTKKFMTQIEQQNVSATNISAAPLPLVSPPSPESIIERRRVSEAQVVQATAEQASQLRAERDKLRDERETSRKLRARLEEADQEIARLNARHKADQENAAEWKAKAELASLASQATSPPTYPEGRESRLEDQLGSLQVRFNTLKKLHDAKSVEVSDIKKQLDTKHKELADRDGERGDSEKKLQECLKENRNIRQKMENFSKDAQVADAEHRRIAAVARLMAPGEFMRNMKSSEAKNNFSQDNSRLCHRNAELETESKLQDTILARLRQKGLGDVINEAWREVCTAEANEDPVPGR